MARTFTCLSDISHEVLKLGDIVYFGERHKHIVVQSHSPNYYLNNVHHDNSRVFRDFGIDKYQMLATLGLPDIGGEFPETRSLEELTLFVRTIMEAAQQYLPKTSSVKFSNSFIRFLQDGKDRSKICKIILDNILDLDVSRINYISNRHDEFISYLPANKIQEINEDGSWSRKNRQQGKPAKIIRQVFTEKMLTHVTDSDFETFANLYKSINDKQGRFKIVEGEDIRTWYEEGMYKSDQGSLNNSCMRYDSCQTFFNIYTEHPNIIKMLILVDEVDLLIGRALLWNLQDNVKLMDRVYGSDSTIEKFRGWAYDNDYYVKKHNGNSVDSPFVNKNGDEKTHFIIALSNLKQLKYPYMDTFCFMDYYKKFITNDTSECPDGYELRNTNGNISSLDKDDEDDCDDDTRCCYVSGRTIYINDNAVWIESICEYVHEDYAVYCDASQEYILERDSFECAFSGRYYDRGYGVEIIGGSMVYENDRHLVCLADGRYCHIDDSVVCKYDDERYHKEDVISIEVNGIMNFVYSNNVEAFKKEHECI